MILGVERHHSPGRAGVFYFLLSITVTRLHAIKKLSCSHDSRATLRV